MFFHADLSGKKLSDFVYSSNREATRLLQVGNYQAALHCLIAAREAMRAAGFDMHHYTADAIRIALLLQKSGRGSEAVIEMKSLLRAVPGAISRLQRRGQLGPGEDSRAFEAGQYAHLLDKLRMIFQRERNTVEAERCASLALAWRTRSAALYQRVFLKNPVDVPHAEPPDLD